VSRLPPPLARRVDRLARRAHAFHRWAHHPLCARYAPDVVRLGRRTRVCRGCASALAGALLGLAAGLAAGLLAAPLEPRLLLAAAALLVAAVPAAIPRTPRARPGGAARRRPAKLLTRLAPTAVAGGLLGQALAAPAPLRTGAAALGGAAVAWALLRYRRRGPDRSACAGCPEGPPGPRCAGLAPIVRRERALSRLAGQWIAAATRPSPASPPTAAPPAA
jgi:hypothetical protein